MKTRKFGSGFTAYTIGEPETREELLDGLRKLHGLDVALVNEAQQWRDLLAKAGFDGDLNSQSAAIRDEHGEQSLADLVADYVIHAEVMQAQRAEVEAGGGNAGALIVAAAWCGQLRERIYWKYGIDPETGARLETLALERQKSRVPFQHQNEGRDQKNAERKAEKESWHADAHRIAAKSNLSGGALETHILDKLAKRGIVKSRRSIRRALSGK